MSHNDRDVVDILEDVVDGKDISFDEFYFMMNDINMYSEDGIFHYYGENVYSIYDDDADDNDDETVRLRNLYEKLSDYDELALYEIVNDETINDDWWMVIRHNASGRYIKTFGDYSSYEGRFDPTPYKEVFPAQKIITVYNYEDQ